MLEEADELALVVNAEHREPGDIMQGRRLEALDL